ncbi:hypothetical protein Tco_1563761 [Tanacetum coccineum]
MDSKIYEIVLDNDGIASKITTKEKVKSLALKAKVTKEQTSDDSDSQGGSDEIVDEEEEAKAFNFLARNSHKFFRKGKRFRRGNRFGNNANKFGKGRGNNFGNKGGESSKPKEACYNCEIEGHFAKNEELLKFNQDFTKTFEKLLKEKRALEDKNSKLSSKINDLEIEVKRLASNKEVAEPCKNCDALTKEVDSLKCNVSKLQDKALSFSKFKESSIALDDMLRYSQTSKAYIVLNKETMRIEESVNVTFEESLPEPKSSYSVEDDRIDEPIVQDLNGSLQVNVSDEGYP